MWPLLPWVPPIPTESKPHVNCSSLQDPQPPKSSGYGKDTGVPISQDFGKGDVCSALLGDTVREWKGKLHMKNSRQHSYLWVFGFFPLLDIKEFDFSTLFCIGHQRVQISVKQLNKQQCLLPAARFCNRIWSLSALVSMTQLSWRLYSSVLSQEPVESIPTRIPQIFESIN